MIDLELLACPRCDRALERAGDTLRCTGCGVDFPSVAGVPWLFAEPGAALEEWRGRMRFSLQRVDRDVEQLRAALARDDVRPATRARLTHLATATDDHGRRLRALLAPLELERHGAAYATQLALRTRLPPDQGLTTYYA
ncbi:MAG TPA: hypothetical protein VFX89_06150, partial [Gammaproteobacteria bacterium]|nr:hypothetical protein [Gammaproteobacteria bacterium]